MGVQFAGNILVQSNGGPLPIANGGTGQTSATSAINALLPSQAGNNNKVLKTDGTNTSWESAAGSPGGADTQIQYNDAGSFGGNAFLVVNKSTGAVTSTSTLSNQGLFISKAVANNRTLDFQTAGSDRWLLQANSTAESGANAGSDFEFVRVADNGATQNQVFTVLRSSGVVDFKANPTVNGSPISPSAAAGTLTGTTLAANVVTSSLTSVGTLSALAITGITTHTGATNHAGASSPVQVGGSAGTSGQVLTSAGAGLTPTWSAPSGVAAAGTLTGTTLAAGVTASSLTSVGSLTRLTTNNHVIVSPSSDYTRSSAINATIITPNQVYMNLTSAPADAKFWQMGLQAGGLMQWQVVDDAITTGATALSISRTGATVNAWAMNGVILTQTFGTVNLSGLATGGFRINNSAGTSGQVLTSAGSSSPPTWSAPTPTAGGSTTQVQYNNAGTLTGTTTFVWDNATTKLSIGGTTSNTVTKLYVAGGIESSAAGSVQLNGGAGSIHLGYLNGAVTSTQDAFVAWGGTSAGAVSPGGVSGTLILSSRNTAGAGVSLSTGNTSRLFIHSAGAWGLNGANYGTTGQVLTSAGSGSAPTWSSISSLANAVTVGATTNSALTITGLAGTTSASSPMSIVASSTTTGIGNSLTITGGTGASGSAGGAVNINGAAGTSAAGGSINLTPGTGSGGVHGVTAFNRSYTEERVSVTATASTAFNCSLGNNFNLALSASITTLTFSNIPAAGRIYSMTMFINQSGGFTITWPAEVKWVGGTAPTLTTTASKTDIITLVTHDGGTNWYGMVAGQNF